MGNDMAGESLLDYGIVQISREEPEEENPVHNGDGFAFPKGSEKQNQGSQGGKNTNNRHMTRKDGGSCPEIADERWEIRRRYQEPHVEPAEG